MSQGDSIRKFALERFIEPARKEGQSEVTIRAGDVDRMMRLSSAMPSVCSALGGNKFADYANVTLRDRTGPANGANVYFRFRLGRQPVSERYRPPVRKRVDTGPATTVDGALNLAHAVVLVSCVKSKFDRPAPARVFYTSPWFQNVRRIVERSGAPWYILSAEYGLVSPDARIAPYEKTLNEMPIAERRSWARDVLHRVLPITRERGRVVIFAGQRYREFLVEPLEREGISVEVPMEGLALGEQLAWLSERA